MIAIPGSHRHAVPTAKLVGKSDTQQRIRVSIYARRNPNSRGETQLAVEKMSGELPGKRRTLSKQEFDAAYGADPKDLKKIADWAESNKLKALESSVPKRRVMVEGTIGDVENAFGVELNEYEHPTTGRFRGREGVVHIPADLDGVIEGVFGLDTRSVGRPRLRRADVAPVRWRSQSQDHTPAVKKRKARPAKASAISNPFPGSFFPPEVAQLYDYPATLDGTGQNVAIFAFNGGTDPDPRGGYKLSALKAYFEQVLGGVTPSITDVVVQGPGNDPGPDNKQSDRRGDSTGEVMLDMCVVGSVAPGAKIFMYFTEFTTQGWIDALSDAISGNNGISVISISYGNPEDDPNGAWTPMGVKQVSQSFAAAKAKQITICCASGDDGSSDEDVGSRAHVDFPASSPNVLGVGGTELVASGGANPTIANETVWNELLHGEGAGGGGISSVFTKPPYQNGVSVPPSANPPHRIGRGVPDVAAVADPVTGVVVMHIDGEHLEAIGGTSAATPIWAALIARLNQGLNAPCGFLNTVLYTRFSSGVLRDITEGNNGAYQAGPGWDACTGLGSPQGQRLLQALKGQPVASTKTKKKR